MDAVESRFSDLLSRGWTFLLLRGLAAIAFGILTWIRPGISLTALALLFGIYVFVDGILAASSAISNRKTQEHWWVVLLVGLVGIGVGILTFMNPAVTALALLFYIAIWAIATGVLEIVAAIRVRKEVEGEWRLILAGIVSVAFGAFLMARPGVGALAVLWVIATYAILLGILLVMLAFKARSFGKQLAHAA